MFPGGKRTQGIAMERYGSLPTRPRLIHMAAFIPYCRPCLPRSIPPQNDARAHVARIKTA